MHLLVFVCTMIHMRWINKLRKQTGLYATIFCMGFVFGLLIRNPQLALQSFLSEGESVQGARHAVSPSSSNLSSADARIQKARVSRVIDGDTIELETGEKVRYIGINTPETQHPQKGKECFGQEATQKNKELVEGKKVLLEKDVSDVDRYGRLLRYVYPASQEPDLTPQSSVNAQLVREGYAYASTYPPDITYQDILNRSQQAAQKEEKGLWSTCPEKSEE